MGTNLQNNLIVQFQGDITSASTSVPISNDLERSAVVTASGCYAVIRNKNGSKIERVKGDAASGTFTFTKRGLDQSDSDVEVSGLKKAWKTGQTMYITLLSSQIVDKQNSNTFGAGTTQTFVNTTSSGIQTVSGASAKIDASGAKLGLRVPNVTTTERILITTNGSIVYDTDLGVHYQYIGGAWTTFASGTTPNASESVAGKVELATAAQRGTGTSVGETGARLVPSNDALVKTSSGASDENKIPVLDATGKLASGFIPDLGLGNNLIDTTYYAGEAITAGQTVLVELPTNIKYTAPLTENSTSPGTMSGGITGARGFKMLTNFNLTIESITKNASCGATRAIIADSSGATLATASFSGVTATFSPAYFMPAGTIWRALCDNSGGAYTATYGGATVARTNVNYTLGSQGGSDDGSNGWNIDSITTNTTSLTLQNIGDVTANTRVAIPVFGTGVNFTTLKLALRKFVSPGVDLGVRIETDSAGNPSGTIVTNGSTTVTSASLTTSLADTTVTFGGNVNLTVGQRFWIVLFAGTYGSETINATNYFAVGYDNTVHTTTRAIMVRNATVYSAGPTFMPYVSSTGILDNVLSLTDADYSYKVDARGFSEDTVSVGGNPRITYDGINNNQTGLVYNQVYYVSNTPGAISTTAGTNSRYIGKGISSNKILIKPYHQF